MKTKISPEFKKTPRFGIQRSFEKSTGPVVPLAINGMCFAMLLFVLPSCGKSEKAGTGAVQQVKEPENTPPQREKGSAGSMSSEGESMLAESQKLFQTHFKKWGDSYFTMIPGMPPEDSTLIERPYFAIVQFDQVSYGLYESPVSEIETRNGVSAQGYVSYSAKMTRRFTPGKGWGEWTGAGAFFRTSYLIKGGERGLEENIAEEGMTSPSAEHLYAAGIPEDTSAYWNRHVAKILQPEFTRAERESAAAKSPAAKSDIWRAFLLEQRKLQHIADPQITATIMNKAAQTYANLCQEQWKSFFQGTDSKLPTFGDPKTTGITSDHPLASGLAIIREQHGSGLKGHFEGRPAFINSIGMKFVWCPENAQEEAERERIYQENRARAQESRGYGTPDLRTRKYSTRGFWISETEVTRGHLATLLGRSAGDPELPRTEVSFEQGKALCQMLTLCEQTSLSFPIDLQYDLPTEAEWDYARDAGEDHKTWKTDLLEQAWLAENSDTKSHPVKGLRPNAWGIFDMIGNVREHVQGSRKPGMAGGSYNTKQSEIQKYGGASTVFGEDAHRAVRKDLGLRIIIRL